jgi:outer membrane protein assembly factor BamB
MLVTKAVRLLMKLSVYQCLAALGVLLSLQSVTAADWPQWRGPNRDGKSPEKGLLKEWPADGPKLSWTAQGLGNGYAGVAVVGDRIFTMGDKEGASYLVAVSTDGGKPIWATKIGNAGAPGWGGFSGPRATPTVSGGLVFTVDQWGELVCVNATDGKEQWRKNYTKDFGATRPEWGFSESPLVDGDQVVVTPGGTQGAMVALERKTGKVLWQSKDFTDAAHYSSIVTADIDGVHQYIQLTDQNLVGIAPKDGSVLWKASRPGKTAVIPTPVVDGNFVYVTSGYAVGCNLFKVSSADGKFAAEQVYVSKAMQNHHGGVIKVGDNIYGYSDGKGFTCQNFKTGDVVWAEKQKIKKGAVSFADGMFYCREEESGNVILVEATPSAYTEKGRFKQPSRAKESAWAHPSIADGKLYIRDEDKLFCYEIR